jgi:hypothetical protein
MFNKIFKRWHFDENESLLINHGRVKFKDKKFNSELCIIIQAPFDYYYLSLYALVLNKYNKEGNYTFVAVFPDIFRIKPHTGFRDFIPFLISCVDRSLTKRKWRKLYKAIGIDEFYELNEVRFLDKLNSFKNSYTIWKKLRSKNELLNLDLKSNENNYSPLLTFIDYLLSFEF